jgi:hypothetical protein
MQIPIDIIVCFVTALLGLQGWQLVTLIKCRVDIASILQWQKDVKRVLETQNRSKQNE